MIRILTLLAITLLLLSLGGCHRSEERDGDAPAADETHPEELPPFNFREDTKNLLLTWVDEKGDFHVVQKVADVPEAARKNVRVVITDREAGTGKTVYVADLSQKRPDGAFAVKTMSRTAWDEVGAARRKARLEALAPTAPAASGAEAPGESKPGAPGEVLAIVYGAEWCKACHDATRYLRQRGVKVVEKDIEESEAAHQEMRNKLKRAKLPTASIPIIDVMGQLLVGFSPAALDRAVRAAQNAKSL
jgi:glutaredoxin